MVSPEVVREILASETMYTLTSQLKLILHVFAYKQNSRSEEKDIIWKFLKGVLSVEAVYKN